jgi:hypothetical protein
MKPFLFPSLLLAMLIPACVPNTPEARIAASPALFDSLTGPHQRLVREGKISKGMPPHAVELALGKPDSRTQGSDRGESFERWEYSSLEPIYFSNFGSIPYHSPYGPAFGYQDAPGVAYVPRIRGLVLFRRNEVSAWEMLR